MDQMTDLGVVLKGKPWGAGRGVLWMGELSPRAGHTENLAMNTKLILLRLQGPWLFWESPNPANFSNCHPHQAFFFFPPKLPYYWQSPLLTSWSPRITYTDRKCPFSHFHSPSHLPTELCSPMRWHLSYPSLYPRSWTIGTPIWLPNWLIIYESQSF